MEERPVAPPPGPTKSDSPLLLAEPQETYVVRVPRDQVYRVPPPENALIVELHAQNAAPNKKKNNRTFSSPLCWIITAIAILSIIIVAFIFTIRASLYEPRYPLFNVAKITSKNLNHIFAQSSMYPPEYEITLRVKNPNPRLSATYKGSGQAVLVYESRRIGTGEIHPATIDGDRPVDMGVSLSGKGIRLSPALKLGLIQKGGKNMQLNMTVSMEVNSWLMNMAMEVTVTCDFRVTKSLINSTVISFEQCDAVF